MFKNSTTRLLTTRLPLLLMPALLLFIAGTAKAEKLQLKHVPADAQWLIHVDYETLNDSAIVEKLRERKSLVRTMVHGWMNQRYGIDPPEDLKSLTMFSRDYREYTGTVIVKSAYEAEKLESRLTQAMNHRKTQWQKYTLHTVTLSKQGPADKGPSGDEEMTVVMVDEGTILLASSVPSAKETLKLLAGESPSLSEKNSPLITDKADSAWIYGAAINLAKLKDHPVAMPVIAQHNRISWSFGEQSDGKLYEHGDFVAQSEDIAKKMKKVLEGVVAYETLWSAGSEPMKAVMKNVKVTQDGNTVGFMWQGSSDQVVAAMDDLFARLNTWKALFIEAPQGQPSSPR